MESAIAKTLKYSIAVENGFLAAGATATVVAIVQSFAIVFGWMS
jgi:hypothetical protein